MKPAELPEGTLTEDDYLALLEVIRHLHACRTRQELRACIGDRLLPLFEAQSASWGWVDLDFSSQKFIRPNVLDSVGVSEEQFSVFPKFFKYNVSFSKALATTCRSVIAYDIDIPREVLHQEEDAFFSDHPEYRPEESSGLKQIKTCIGTVDRPDFTLGLGIHRQTPFDKPWTLRDIRLLDLIQPHLLQVIKTVTLNEELNWHRPLVESLAQVPTPTALVSPDQRIIFRNPALSRLLPGPSGQRLPRNLAGPLKKEASNYDPPYRSNSSARELSFVKFPQGVFRLIVSLLNGQGEDGRCWLLRLKPVADPFAQMNLRMQEAGLTLREMEVAVLVRDGMDDSEIAARLFIQPSTVRNHLKCIFRKMNVPSRPKLMAGLMAEPGPEGKES